MQALSVHRLLHARAAADRRGRDPQALRHPRAASPSRSRTRAGPSTSGGRTRERRLRSEAELQLTFTAPAFAEFLAGSLDVADAAADGQIRAFGDLTLLERFGQLLQPEGASLGWDTL